MIEKIAKQTVTAQFYDSHLPYCQRRKARRLPKCETLNYEFDMCPSLHSMDLMSHPSSPKHRAQSIEAQFAQAERAYQRLNKSIDQHLERAQDLEAQRAIALYKSGKAKVFDLDESIRQARQLVG